MAESELAAEGGNTNNNEEVAKARTETKTVTTMVTEDMLSYAGSNVNPPLGGGAIRNLTNVPSGEREHEHSRRARCPYCRIGIMTSYSNEIIFIMGTDIISKMRSPRFIKKVQRTWEKSGLKPTNGRHVCHLCKVTHTSPAQLVSHMKSMSHCYKMGSGIVISSQSTNQYCTTNASYYCNFCRIFLKDPKRVLKHISMSKHLANVERYDNEN